MILALWFLLGIIPLVGIAWIVVSGWLTTVDGLFTTLILLTISGIFLLNALWEARIRGILKLRRKKVEAPQPQTSPAAAPAPSAQPSPTQPQTAQAQKTR